MAKTYSRSDVSISSISILTDHSYNKKDVSGFGMRHLFAFLAYTALTISYMNRNNLCIGIVAMVSFNSSSEVSEDSEGNVCPITSPDNETTFIAQTGEFDWDEQTQGILLGSFFYGYTASSLLGGLAAEVLGGRIVLGFTVFTSSLLCLLSPICARTSLALFIAVRVLSGLAQGPLYPALFSLMATWIPSQERAVFSSIILTGNHLGTVLSLSLGGVMASSNFMGGWPSLFYVFGLVGLLWSVAWFTLVRDRPEEHPFISSSELKYLKANALTVRSNEKRRIPWKDILRSPPFLCLIVLALGDGMGYYTILTEIPTYMSNIQHFDLASNGLVSSLPYACVLVFGPIYGFVINALSKKGFLTVKNVRRISAALGLITPSVGLLGVCFADCNSTLVLVFLCLSVGINSANYCGGFIAEQDIAPNYAATLKGIISTFGSATGIVAPLITGAIISGNQTLSAWHVVFLIASVSYLIGSISYLVFGSHEVQPWNEPKEKEEIKKY